MTTRCLVILVISLFAFISASGQSVVEPQKRLGPIEGEVLAYNVYLKTGFIYFSLGEAIFTTTEVDELFELKVEASTYPRWRRFYEFESDFTSLLDSSASYPQSFLRESIEKGNTVFDSIRFDQEAMTAQEFVSNNDGEIFNYDLSLSDKVYDMVSLFHSVRYIDYPSLESGKVQRHKLLHNRREYDIVIQFKNEEEKRVKRGDKYHSYKVEINAIKGLHFDGSQVMTMWITTDDKRIPVAFETPLKLGSLRIALKK